MEINKNILKVVSVDFVSNARFFELIYFINFNFVLESFNKF